MRTLLILLVLTYLAGCQKSAVQKQQEADQCWLKYGSARMETCLTAEHGWDSTDAYIAGASRRNRGE
jgi:hypothetical protein